MRLLFFAGSTREGSYNKKLAALARHIAEANGIEAVQVDLKDYPMPLYNGDLEAKDGPPEKARAFKALLGEYQGVFIASPEYNSSITPLLKNTLDWVTPGEGQGRDRARSLPDARVRHLRRLARLLRGDAQPAPSPPDPRGWHRRDRHSAADRRAARDGRVRGRRQSQGRQPSRNSAPMWSRRSPSPPRALSCHDACP